MGLRWERQNLIGFWGEHFPHRWWWYSIWNRLAEGVVEAGTITTFTCKPCKQKLFTASLYTWQYTNTNVKDVTTTEKVEVYQKLGRLLEVYCSFQNVRIVRKGSESKSLSETWNRKIPWLKWLVQQRLQLFEVELNNKSKRKKSKLFCNCHVMYCLQWKT